MTSTSDHAASAQGAPMPAQPANAPAGPAGLPEPYRQALRALQDQAAAVSAQLPKLRQDAAGAGGEASDRKDLAGAQQRMALYPAEVRHIMRAVLAQRGKTVVTIPDLDEARLAALLWPTLA